MHSVGVHGKVKFVSSGIHPYTGVFRGADYGIVRLTTAAETHLLTQPLVPSLSLKFLRDGIDSANVVAVHSFDGQPGDWNFFSQDLYNHLPYPKSLLPKALTAKFATMTPYVQQVGLSDMCNLD